ncbi:unnamed protein product [Closterium sp. NIES-53]
MWEERLLYQVTYWEHGSPLAELPVRFVKREPREAYQVVERPLEEELGILTWKVMGKMEAARKQYEEIWGVSDNLWEHQLNLRALQKPLVLLELYGGIATGLAAVLKVGHTVCKYLYVDNSGEANLMAWHHIKLLKARYHEQLMEEAAERGAEWLCRGVEEIDNSMIAEWGRIDLVIAGWSCQGYSKAGRGRGMGDERSAQFGDLVRVPKLIKKQQGDVTYIIENIDMADDPRPAVQAANKEITRELGAGVAWDAAQNGSRAHRPLAAQVTERDHPTQYPCNKVGEPRQAWPTLVAHENAKGFKKVGSREGPGMVYDVARGDWEEPTAQERELAMGFMAGATACDQMTEKDRRAALGRAMDLNALHWLLTTMSNHLERKYADPQESEEEEEEKEEEEMEESKGEGRGDTPEEFHDSDFDMEGGFFDPPDWPPIGPVYMALDVASEGAGQKMEGGGRVEGTKEVPNQGQEEERPAWDLGKACKGSRERRCRGCWLTIGRHLYTLKELGCCNCAIMKVSLTTTVPVYQRRRRMSPQDLEACKEKCLEQLEAGLIQRSESGNAAATVVAARMDLVGMVISRRMCGEPQKEVVKDLMKAVKEGAVL